MLILIVGAICGFGGFIILSSIVYFTPADITPRG